MIHIIMIFRSTQKALVAKDRQAIKILMAVRNKQRNTHEGWKEAASDSQARTCSVRLQCEGTVESVSSALAGLGFDRASAMSAVSEAVTAASKSGAASGDASLSTAWVDATAKLLQERCADGHPEPIVAAPAAPTTTPLPRPTTAPHPDQDFTVSMMRALGVEASWHMLQAVRLFPQEPMSSLFSLLDGIAKVSYRTCHLAQTHITS